MLIQKNCQFIAKDYKVPTYVCECTAFESEEEFKAKVKLEAIKEFAEKAVTELIKNYSSNYCHWIDDTIDSLVKEMESKE